MLWLTEWRDRYKYRGLPAQTVSKEVDKVRLETID